MCGDASGSGCPYLWCVFLALVLFPFPYRNVCSVIRCGYVLSLYSFSSYLPSPFFHIILFLSNFLSLFIVFTSLLCLCFPLYFLLLSSFSFFPPLLPLSPLASHFTILLSFYLSFHSFMLTPNFSIEYPIIYAPVFSVAIFACCILLYIIVYILIFRVITWNVKGFNSPIKSSCSFSLLQTWFSPLARVAFNWDWSS